MRNADKSLYGACMEEGQGYLMLLKYLKLFDAEKSYIEPVRREQEASWCYFSARVGYVEISRNSRLEVRCVCVLACLNVDGHLCVLMNVRSSESV